MTPEQAEMANAWDSRGGKKIQGVLTEMIGECRRRLEKLYRDPEKLTGKTAAKWAHRMHALEDFRDTISDKTSPNPQGGEQ